jgi:tripeptidyl-peptidase I
VLEHVDFIQPTTMFARTRPQKSTALFANGPAVHDADAGTIQTSTGVHINASCNSTITPECLKQIYNAVGYTPSSTNGNIFAITGYLEQYINNADLKQFFKTYVPEAVNSTYKTISVNGLFGILIPSLTTHL